MIIYTSEEGQTREKGTKTRRVLMLMYVAFVTHYRDVGGRARKLGTINVCVYFITVFFHKTETVATHRHSTSYY